MTDAQRVRCLDEELGDYAAGRLDAARRRPWERHLVSCGTCAHAVAEERRLQAAFAGAPSMPGDLRASLLALGGGGPLAPAASGQAARRVDPLMVLSPGARPCHRSALRATVIAAAAAGASAAAALSLTVISTPPARVGTTATPAIPAVGSPGQTQSPTLGTASVVPAGWARTGVVPRPTRQAESTP